MRASRSVLPDFFPAACLSATALLCQIINWKGEKKSRNFHQFIFLLVINLVAEAIEFRNKRGFGVIGRFNVFLVSKDCPNSNSEYLKRAQHETHFLLNFLGHHLRLSPLQTEAWVAGLLVDLRPGFCKKGLSYLPPSAHYWRSSIPQSKILILQIITRFQQMQEFLLQPTLLGTLVCRYLVLGS